MVRDSSTTPQPRVVPGIVARAPATFRVPIFSEPSVGNSAPAILRLRCRCASLVLILLPNRPPSFEKSHCSPNSWPSVISISTIMASINTCARRISRRAITASNAAISSVSAVIIRLLVPASASMVDSPFPARLLPPFSSSREMFCMTRVSTSAASTASAYSR